MGEDLFLREHAGTLFELVRKKIPSLTIGEDSSQVRNVVRKCLLRGHPCFIKIGRSENLINLLVFLNNHKETSSFRIPSCLTSGNLSFLGENFTYYIEKAVDGISLYESGTFNTFNKQVLKIIHEIDSFPDLSLPRTAQHLSAMSTKEERANRKKKLEANLAEWVEGSSMKYTSMYKKSLQLLDTLITRRQMEIGTVHGEFNFHHIILDHNNIVWIIDWERISQGYPRFFDLAEYIGRLIVSVDNGFDYATTVLHEFVSSKEPFSNDTLLFGIYNRILGVLWERTKEGRAIFVEEKDENRIISAVQECLVY